MNEASFVCDDVPQSAVLKREPKNKYGIVPGLDEGELADPGELKRQLFWEEFGPVMLLPSRWKPSGFKPDVDEDGMIKGAFATVDFDRQKPELDKARYKAGKLREQLRDVLIMISIVKERLPRTATYLVLKYLRMGIIKLEHVASEDVVALVRMYRRAEQLREEIARLQEASQRRRERQARVLLG